MFKNIHQFLTKKHRNISFYLYEKLFRILVPISRWFNQYFSNYQKKREAAVTLNKLADKNLGWYEKKKNSPIRLFIMLARVIL